MKNIKELSEMELIKAIAKCDKEILKLLAVEVENYPGAIMALGDFYTEKYILMDELLKRKLLNPYRTKKHCNHLINEQCDC